MLNLRSTRFYSTMYFRSKTYCQECWKRNFNWDHPLLCDLLSRFEKWQKEIVFDKRYKSTTFLRFQRT